MLQDRQENSGFYCLNGSLALRSFIYVDVGEPTSRSCSMTGMRQDHHLPILQDFELLGTIVGFAVTSRSSTERFVDFSSESVVSHLVPWVSFWVFWFVFGCFWLCLLVLFVGFVWQTRGFCSHLFSNMWE